MWKNFPVNRAETFFESSPLLNPSSLAFFVSGFTEIVRETKSKKHLVSVRESEKDYTEKLFEITEKILESVELLFDAEFPNDVLHSVALPNYENDVGSFYGFNNYR
jgi:hypothetical protein